MNLNVKEISNLVKGNLINNIDLKINAISEIQNIKKYSLSFLIHKKYKRKIIENNHITIVTDDMKISKLNKKNNYIIVPNVYEALIKILKHNIPAILKTGITKSSKIHKDAIINKNSYIGANTSIGEKSKISENTQIYENCVIGKNVIISKNCKIYPGVIIYDNTTIGENCIIHSGAIIGSDGFGFFPNKNTYNKIPQTGNVIINDDVEIGANTTIDKGTIGSTIIKKGVKLDNLIHVAHNVTIGKNTVIAAQTGIAGSTKIGNNCMIGGQVGIVGHIEIANNVKIAAQSGVSKSILKEGQIVQGSPAFEIKKYNKAYIKFKNNTN